MKQKGLKIAFAVWAMVALTTSVVFASSTVTLKIGTATRVEAKVAEVPIVVDNIPYNESTNPVGIAGAAFTLVYPPELTVEVRSDFFQTFATQFKAVKPTYTGETTATVDGITYDRPLLSNITTDSLGQKNLAIAAARCIETAPDPSDPKNKTLFVLTVTTTTQGNFDIDIIPTKIDNAAAGYTTPSAVNILVGAAPSTVAPSDPNAFPVLIDATSATADWETHVVGGTVSFTDDPDPDDDGLTTTQEATYGTNANLWDTDGDGYSDGEEVAQGTNPLSASSMPNITKSDFDRTGCVDGLDLAAFGEKWDLTQDDANWDWRFNLDTTPNADGKQVIDGLDLAAFGVEWDKCWK